MLWRMRARSRTASMPNTRAFPREGVWKPRSVLISVDFPAPLGPSRPMALPRSSPVSESRTTRPPSRTSNRSSSITGSMTGVPNDETGVPAKRSLFVRWGFSSLGWLTPISLYYVCCSRLVPRIEQGAEGEEIESEEAAVAGDFDPVLLSEGADDGGPCVCGQLADRIRRVAAEQRE